MFAIFTYTKNTYMQLARILDVEYNKLSSVNYLIYHLQSISFSVEPPLKMKCSIGGPLKNRLICTSQCIDEQMLRNVGTLENLR